MVRAAGLEPALLAKADFESAASTIPPQGALAWARPQRLKASGLWPHPSGPAALYSPHYPGQSLLLALVSGPVLGLRFSPEPGVCAATARR